MKTFIALLTLAVASSASGGISNLKAHRELSVLVGDPPSGQSYASGQAGLFDRTAEAHLDRGNGDHSDGVAAQRSVVGPDSVTASGAFDLAPSDDPLSFTSSVDASFAVPQGAPYHLSAHLAFDEESGRPPQDSFFSLRLRNLTTATDVLLPRPELHFENDLAFEGTLAPGDYEVRFALHDDVGIGLVVGSYRMNFALGDGPHAVPLPPAGYAGLLALAGLAGGQWWSARRRRQLPLEQ